MTAQPITPQATAALEGVIVPETAAWEYEDYVKAGQEIRSRSAWMLGDLAAAVDTKWGEGTLKTYAHDIGMAYATLRAYKAVAIAYPDESVRHLTTWSVYQALAAQPDRAKLTAPEQTNTTPSEAGDTRKKPKRADLEGIQFNIKQEDAIIPVAFLYDPKTHHAFCPHCEAEIPGKLPR
jgi:hypothetical protein